MTLGIQVLVAHKGSIIFQKSYGCQTYENVMKVSKSGLYDVDVTKMMQMFLQKRNYGNKQYFSEPHLIHSTLAIIRIKEFTAV